MENNFNENGFTPYESEPIANEFGGEAAPETPEKKGSLLKKLLIPGIALVAVIAVALALLLLGGGTYKTPIKPYTSFMNAKNTDDAIDACIKSLNGFGASEVKTVYNIIKKNDDFKDLKEELDENLFEAKVEELGKNFKYKYTVKDKEEIDDDELEEFEEQLKEAGEQLEDMVKELEDMDDDELEEAAEEMGVKKADIKKIIKAADKLAKKLKKAKVTAGYTLELEGKVTGSEVDEDDEEIEVEEFIVIKVSGKWISPNTIMAAAQLVMGGMLGGMAGLIG